MLAPRYIFEFHKMGMNFGSSVEKMRIFPRKHIFPGLFYGKTSRRIQPGLLPLCKVHSEIDIIRKAPLIDQTDNRRIFVEDFILIVFR